MTDAATLGARVRVLIVDDEAQILKALAINLKARGFDVMTASTGTDALVRCADVHPDVVVLDLGLPDIDGIEVIEGLRGWTNVPIIVLSVRSDEADKVAALDAGADDFVTKPFGINELLARIRAATRRADLSSGLKGAEATIQTDAFTIDLAARRVRNAAGVDVRLTPTEWHLVEVLVRNEGRLVTQVQLLHEVWGPAYETETNYLRVYLAQIRRKLEPTPGAPRHFVTEPGIGYRFER